MSKHIYTSVADVQLICTNCGRPHDPETRQKLIRPMVETGEFSAREIMSEWSCFYSGSGAERRYYRDREAILRQMTRGVA